MINLHPSLPFLIALMAVPIVSPITARVLSILASLFSTVLLWTIPLGHVESLQAIGHDWVVLQMQPMGRVFGIAFALFSLISCVYSWTETRKGPRAASLALPAAAIGVCLAGDWFSFFLCWEWLTVASVFLIWSGKSKTALQAGLRYLFLHVAGGACLLGGILLHLSQGGSVLLQSITLEGTASYLLLIGLAVNAAIIPLHAWLPDSYPQSSIWGSVFLSAFTTKTAVYALARVLPGNELLVWAGVAMALYGVVFAVLENQVRKLFSYHIISQVGFMVCGIGLGSDLALNGTTAHAFCHIFYKGLLMMCAGALLTKTGTEKISELGGLGKEARLLFLFSAIGALSISGLPLLNGFISKSMVISAASLARAEIVELALLVASTGTFLSIGLKWIYFTYFGNRQVSTELRPLPVSMYLGLGTAAMVCIVTGFFPGLLYAVLPYKVDYHPYSLDHVFGSLQLLFATTVGFYILRTILAPKDTQTADVDRIYRPLMKTCVYGLSDFLARTGGRTQGYSLRWIESLLQRLQAFKESRERASLARLLLTIIAGLVVAAYFCIPPLNAG